MAYLSRFSLLALGCIAFLSSCSDYALSPVIDSVHADKDEVETNETVTVYCEAFGVYGDDLTFVWTADAGSFPNGNTERTIDWKAPDYTGVFTLTVEATNGSNFKSESIEMTVISSGASTEYDGVVDYQGKEYKYKIIGNQTWMIENMAYLPSVSSNDQADFDVAHYYVYGYYGYDIQEAKAHPNYGKYGVLYNWVAATTICPPGWHLPSDAEWKELEIHLGMSTAWADELGDRSDGEIGIKLKATYGWVNGGVGDNSSGFTALPAGYCHPNGFEQIDSLAHFWTSYASGDDFAYRRDLYYSGGGINRYDEYKNYGFSVRCIKD